MSAKSMGQFSLIVAVVFQFAVSIVSAQESVDLSPKFEADRTAYVEQDAEVIAESKSPMGQFDMTLNFKSGILKHVKAGTKGANVDLTIDRAAMTFDSSMGPSFFDSDIPDEEQSAQWGQILGPQVGSTLGLEVDGSNKVVKCTGMEALVKKIDAEATENMFWQMERKKYDAAAYAAQWQNLALSIFPEKEVKVGDTWTKRYIEDMAELKDFGFDCTYKLESISKNNGETLAEISFQGKVADKQGDYEADSWMPVSGIEVQKATLSGTATINVDRGELVRREDHAEIAYSGSMGQGGDEPNMSTSRKITRNYVVKSVDERRAEKEKNTQIAAAKKRKAEEAQAERRRRFADAKKVDVSTASRENPIGVAESWPQWGGPHGDFKANSAGLADKWPEGGPKMLWSRELGDGYSSIVSDGKWLYTMYRPVDEAKNKTDEIVVALDPKTGETIWEFKYEAPYVEGTDASFGRGPHSTPLIVGDRLFTVGSMVDLYCLDKNTGKVIWHHNLIKEMGASHMMYGYGASPLAHDGKIILPVGGEGKAVVAFNQDDGKVAWKYADFGATHASVFVIKQEGKEQLVLFAASEIAGIDPSDGSTMWRVEHPTQWGANISTPVWGHDGWMFVSSAYGMGSRGIRLSADGGKPVAKEMWHNNKMKIHHGNAVRVGNFVYGASGDFGPVFYAAVDIETGELAWRNREVGKGSSIFADGKMLILNESGTLFLAKVSPTELKIKSQVQVSDGRTWTVPTLIGKRLYLRDRKGIMALDLG